jgi:glycosyltransferase involved in cell wall biosynthesis
LPLNTPGHMSISVVIPAFNASQLLPATLESVLNQTLRAAEILVIDDGSTDNTAEVAEAFGSSVRVIRRPNSRQAASRNLGAAEATSEWIAFVDADDLWEKDKLEKQMLALKAKPEASLCYTARQCFEQHGDEIRKTILIPVPPAEGIRKALYRNTTFLPSSVIIRRSSFLSSGGFNARYTIGEDWDLWLRLLHSEITFAACQEPLLLYRMHAGGVSRRADIGLPQLLEIYRRQVLPHLPPISGWLRYNRIRSEHEAVTSMVLREGGYPGYLNVMAASILRDPFHYAHRYKVLAHMLYKRALSR